MRNIAVEKGRELSYEAYCAELAGLAQSGRRFQQLTLGRSVLGRPLTAYGFGHPTGAALFLAGVHGSERMTSELLRCFVRELGRCLAQGSRFCGMDLNRILEARGALIVPVINPDGAEISRIGADGGLHMSEQIAWAADEAGVCFEDWQGNARARDLDCAPERCSEPEFRALERLVEVFRPQRMYDFHYTAPGTADRRTEEILYRGGNRPPEQSRLMAELLAAAAGTKLVRNQNAALGQLREWFLDATGQPAFRFELGRTRLQPDPREVEPLFSRITEALLYMLIL